MGKKMNVPSLFKNKESNHPWQWPSCNNPKTLSFRAGDDVIKTVNSVFLEHQADDVQTPESWFTKSSESTSFSTHYEDSEEDEEEEETLEVIVRGARSERLFFQPEETRAIVEEAKGVATTTAAAGDLPFEESVMLAMESEDPYVDFRKSMEEMVETHGLKDWDCLEELLGWYLKVNGKKNHGYIVGAFVDLLVGMAPPCSDSTSYSSAASSFSSLSSPLSALAQKGISEDDDMSISS